MEYDLNIILNERWPHFLAMEDDFIFLKMDDNLIFENGIQHQYLKMADNCTVFEKLMKDNIKNYYTQKQLKSKPKVKQ